MALSLAHVCGVNIPNIMLKNSYHDFKGTTLVPKSSSPSKIVAAIVTISCIKIILPKQRLLAWDAMVHVVIPSTVWPKAFMGQNLTQEKKFMDKIFTNDSW